MKQSTRLLINQLQRENSSLRGRIRALEAITGQSVPDQEPSKEKACHAAYARLEGRIELCFCSKCNPVKKGKK